MKKHKIASIEKRVACFVSILLTGGGTNVCAQKDIYNLINVIRHHVIVFDHEARDIVDDLDD